MMYLIVLFWVLLSLVNGKPEFYLELEPEENDSENGGLEHDVTFLKNNLHAVTRQLMLQQFFTEERIRTEGQSGIKQIRLHKSGPRNYFTESFVGGSAAAIHDHANNVRTVGMGEYVAVMNGIEFRTRHNDYRLYMPSTTSDEYHAVEDVPYPDVPDQVKGSVENQITEMREYFKAWYHQNTTHRDYRPYFKAVLCYLEGAWTKPSENVDEPFHSDRHFMDASSWFDLMEKIRFTSYTGSKSRLENLGFLPTKVIDFLDNDIPLISQWNYRIVCHPLKKDLKTSRLNLVEDLKTRVMKSYSKKMLEYSRSARFQISPNDDKRWDGVSSDYEYLDELMEEIPGKNNYGGKLYDEGFDSAVLKVNTKKKEKKVVSNYHRWFRVEEKDAMGLDIVHRGFSDDFLFTAMTTQDRIPGLRYTKCLQKKKQEECMEMEQKMTYAIPLEIIYLTPLLKWNPYNLEYKGEWKSESGKTVTSNGRNGDCSPNLRKKYDGINSKIYYMTPTEFFEKEEYKSDSADTTKGEVCVLDQDGESRKVRASGTRIFLPSIPGIGNVRTRYPIFPVHDEGSSISKELNALRELILDPEVKERITADDEEKDVVLKMRESRSSSVTPHTHEVILAGWEVKQLKFQKNKIVRKKTTYSEGHEHVLLLRWNPRNKWFWYKDCDGKRKCSDDHPTMLDVVQDEGVEE